MKNKHDGIFPIGSNAKRKIPKNIEENCDHLFIPNIERFYQDFEDFVNQIDNAVVENKKHIDEVEVIRLFEIFDENNDKEVQLFKSAMKAMVQMGADYDKFDKLKESLNINQILSFYLVCIYHHCSYQFFKEYFYLVFMMIKALNDKGDLFIDKNEKYQPNIKKDEKIFCESSEVHVAADMLNLFIAELFPNYLKALKDDRKIEFKYLGFEDENIKNLILMSKHFANWLFNSELSEYRLEINVDF